MSTTVKYLINEELWCIATRDTGIISAIVPKKLLQIADTNGYHISARGYNATSSNSATFDAISKTYSYLAPGKSLCSLSVLIKNSLTIL
ncbi:hypothetical protein A6R68_22091 [Neotoma lepida]|uniref:Uncharacterized protein n=1 Tax=Neotoma lepida TaxID=56216 RepID=A0A1A6HMP8_NEOLE|nr:hypothetical protein A6R68_22091 [Neotoma lepida]